MSQLTIIPEEYRSEFSVDSEGKVGIGRKALARLVGTSHQAISKWLNGKGFEGVTKSRNIAENADVELVREGNLIPDTTAAIIIEYYAFDAGRNCKEQARKVYRAFAAIGIRTFFQQQLGWQPPEPAIESERTKKLEAENKQLEGIVTWLWERMEQVEQKITSNTENINRLYDNQDLFETWHKEHRAKHKELEQKYEQTVRDKEYKRQISLLIAKHCGDNEGFRKASWNGIYGELIRQTEFQVYAAAKMWNCSCIDAVEIGGYMSKLYAIASEVLV